MFLCKYIKYALMYGHIENIIIFAYSNGHCMNNKTKFIQVTIQINFETEDYYLIIGEIVNGVIVNTFYVKIPEWEKHYKLEVFQHYYLSLN
jgi:hypothetical protein